ncbi:hypothetical protein [Actinocorallia populi]|nr:hypothetical protein [Actinocorallia populi]
MINELTTRAKAGEEAALAVVNRCDKRADRHQAGVLLVGLILRNRK